TNKSHCCGISRTCRQGPRRQHKRPGGRSAQVFRAYAEGTRKSQETAGDTTDEHTTIQPSWQRGMVPTTT
ncbi:unnamed protein product, partial [Laminaria digitata]